MSKFDLRSNGAQLANRMSWNYFWLSSLSLFRYFKNYCGFFGTRITNELNLVHAHQPRTETSSSIVRPMSPCEGFKLKLIVFRRHFEERKWFIGSAVAPREHLLWFLPARGCHFKLLSKDIEMILCKQRTPTCDRSARSRAWNVNKIIISTYDITGKGNYRKFLSGNLVAWCREASAGTKVSSLEPEDGWERYLVKTRAWLDKFPLEHMLASSSWKLNRNWIEIDRLKASRGNVKLEVE